MDLRLLNKLPMLYRAAGQGKERLTKAGTRYHIPAVRKASVVVPGVLSFAGLGCGVTPGR